MPKWNELLFEWDDDKAHENLRKHGVDFTVAMRVFDDPDSIEAYDAEHSEEENRYHIIGLVDDVLFVVYTERKERIRLISARKATAMERSVYYDRNLYS